MKLTKMSLVAALLVGSSAMAIENTNVSGNVNVFYSTSDAKGQTSNAIVGQTGSGDLFNKDSSAADISLNLAVTTDLVKNDIVSISAGASYAVLTTLGLENNFVSNVWGGAHGDATVGTGSSYAGSYAGGAKVENANWFTEAWAAATVGKSTLKLGRMELDTPLAFSEKWSAEVNTFEAAVAINQDLPDTTIVAGFIGNGNGNEAFGQDLNGGLSVTTLGLATAPVVNSGGKFATFGTNGAYALGVVNNSFKPLTVQAWYYDVSKLAQAYWLQADLNLEGILAGVQYASVDYDKRLTTLASNTDNDVAAVMVGYEMKDTVTLKVAFSQTGNNKYDLGAGSNVATNTGDSKLYTKTYWNYGWDMVAADDTDAMKFSVSSPVNGLFDLCASFTSLETKYNDVGLADGKYEMQEIAIAVKKSFGPLDAKLAYVNVDEKEKDSAGTWSDSYNMVIAHIGLNF